jgi:nucleoside triphosphate diphosphatase
MDAQRETASDPATLFAEAVSIVARLRAPGGCPWDREQTLESIQPYTLEETYEVFDAIERGHWPDLCEELGDLLLQVLFYAEISAESGKFTIAEVIEGLNRKLVRRHPHVFHDPVPAGGDPAAAGDDPAAAASADGKIKVKAPIDSAQVLRNWDAIKKAEKAASSESASHSASLLDTIPRSLPALLEARKLGSRAGKNGFDWPDAEGLFAKLEEEAAELRQAIENHSAMRESRAVGVEGGALPGAQVEPSIGLAGTASEAIVSEVGDLLFTAVNLARHLQVDPEFALRHTNAKFRRRFAAMEAGAAGQLKDLPPLELESLWTKAKEAETR